MKAYAIVLSQQQIRRDVRASLVFTEQDRVWNQTWTAEEIGDISGRVAEEVHRRARSLERTI